MPDHSPVPIRRKRKNTRLGGETASPAIQTPGISGMQAISMDTPENILAMQRMIGNQRVQRLLATSGDATGKVRRDGTGTKDKPAEGGTPVDNKKETKPAPTWENATLQPDPALTPDDAGMKWVIKQRTPVGEPPKRIINSDFHLWQNTIAKDNIGSGTEAYATLAAGQNFWQAATLPDTMPADATGALSYRTDTDLNPGTRQTLKDGTAVYVFKQPDGIQYYTADANVTDKVLDFWTLKFDTTNYNVPKSSVEHKSGGFTRVATPLWDEKGPKPEDVKQTNLGDCYFQAALIELAQSNPEHIKRYMMWDNAGTVTVRYWYKNGKSYEPEYIKMDKSVATDAGGNELYNSGALWVKMAQKAFAIFAGMHGKYGELLKSTGGGGYKPLENGNSFRTYTMIYGNAAIKTGQDTINYDEDSPNDLGNNENLIELLLQKSNPDKYMLPGQAMNLNVLATPEEHMKRLENVLPDAIESLKLGGSSFDRQRMALISLKATVARARKDYEDKKEGETPESINDLSKAAQRIIDGDFGKKTVPNNKKISSIQTVLELMYDLKNVGTDNSPGTRFVYSHHLYAIMGAEFKDDQGKVLKWDNDLKKARRQIVRWADANLSTVSMRNPHRTNSPTTNIATTPGPDEGKFTLSLAQFIRNYSHIDFAKVKTSG